MAHRVRRIAKELSDIHEDKESGVDAHPADESGQNMTELMASLVGPPDTPYEGGTFFVDVTIPPDYPFRPPRMKFVTKVWHPNISSQTGAICLDTLAAAWSPILTIKAALISLQSLLASPEPRDPQDGEVASMMLKNPEQFEQKARDWAIHHASAPKETRWSVSAAKSKASAAPIMKISKEEQQRQQLMRYQGYNKELIDRFVHMGFEIDRVVDAFNYVGIDKNDGEDYEPEEAYMGDITARLLGEP